MGNAHVNNTYSFFFFLIAKWWVSLSYGLHFFGLGTALVLLKILSGEDLAVIIPNIAVKSYVSGMIHTNFFVVLTISHLRCGV